jgi:hypothetical protein
MQAVTQALVLDVAANPAIQMIAQLHADMHREQQQRLFNSLGRRR